MLLSYLLVSISGAAVLALEILGTRVLGPFFGVSLFLWSALITVTLASLSVGYAVGGRLADRGPRTVVLSRVFLAAGLWVVFIPWLRSPLLDVTAGLEMRAAVLIAAAVLFAPPLTLLGMVSPYVIRMSAHDLGEVGRTAGDLFAVSTVASVGAALATGFWLIPNLGVTRLLVVVGALLWVAAAICFWSRRQVVASVLCLVAAGLAPWAQATPEEGRGRVLLRVDSAYSEVTVLERPEGRYLMLDGGVHTIASIPDGESLHQYEPVMRSCGFLFDSPGRALLLGLGGGLLARDMVEDGWSVDAVEIDPVVVAAARDFFDLPQTDGLRVFTQDARRYLLESTATYDLILVDVFGSSSIPFHLASVEMFELARTRLEADGVLAMNVETRQWRDPIVAHLGSALAASFPSVWALPTQEPPNALGNVVLVASPQVELQWPEEKLPRPADHLGDPADHWRVVQVNHAWDNRFQPDLTARLWTDDRSGVELESEGVHRVARQQLHEFFSDASSGP